jgi:hypothetical protein
LERISSFKKNFAATGQKTPMFWIKKPQNKNLTNGLQLPFKVTLPRVD